MDKEGPWPDRRMLGSGEPLCDWFRLDDGAATSSNPIAGAGIKPKAEKAGNKARLGAIAMPIAIQS